MIRISFFTIKNSLLLKNELKMEMEGTLSLPELCEKHSKDT